MEHQVLPQSKQVTLMTHVFRCAYGVGRIRCVNAIVACGERSPRACAAGEGESRQTHIFPICGSSPSPYPLPVKNGERERSTSTRITLLLPIPTSCCWCSEPDCRDRLARGCCASRRRDGPWWCRREPSARCRGPCGSGCRQEPAESVSSRFSSFISSVPCKKTTRVAAISFLGEQRATPRSTTIGNKGALW